MEKCRIFRSLVQYYMDMALDPKLMSSTALLSMADALLKLLVESDKWDCQLTESSVEGSIRLKL